MKNQARKVTMGQKPAPKSFKNLVQTFTKQERIQLSQRLTLLIYYNSDYVNSNQHIYMAQLFTVL